MTFEHYKVAYYEAVKNSVALEIVAKGYASTEDILITITPQYVAITSDKKEIGDIFSEAFPDEADQYKGRKEIQMLYPKSPNRAERRKKR